MQRALPLIASLFLLGCETHWESTPTGDSTLVVMLGFPDVFSYGAEPYPIGTGTLFVPARIDCDEAVEFPIHQDPTIPFVTLVVQYPESYAGRELGVTYKAQPCGRVILSEIVEVLGPEDPPWSAGMLVLDITYDKIPFDVFYVVIKDQLWRVER